MTMTNPKPGDQGVERGMEAFVGIEARPLHMPNLLDVKPVSPEITFRWGHRLAGEGLRYQQLIYAGFLPAEPKDVKDVPQMLVKDGKVIYGELILMKIATKLYQGALLHNHNTAIRRGDRFKTTDNDGNEIKRTARVDAAIQNAPPALRNKLRAFVPSTEELKAHGVEDDDKEG